MTRESQMSTEILSFFAAGTLVATHHGNKPIEEIAVGDCVLSFPRDSVPPDRPREPSEAKYRKVTLIAKLQADQLVDLTIMDLAAGLREALRATPSSLIYQSAHGWNEASRMGFGAKLENSVFGNLLVTKSRQGERSEAVYGLLVEEFGTYYTGEVHAWVHC
ncbi:MAG: hypothetical protein EKK59_03590 [Neisseriaceae bacterium]|nr:MAG: hypothetical protein EKK59_03590 [Neisseriaceae bacterium]